MLLVVSELAPLPHKNSRARNAEGAGWEENAEAQAMFWVSDSARQLEKAFEDCLKGKRQGCRSSGEDVFPPFAPEANFPCYGAEKASYSRTLQSCRNL